MSGREMILSGVAVFIIIGLLIGATYGARLLDAEMDREVFKQTTTYTEAAAQFLAKSYREYNEAEDAVEQNGICQYVAITYPNLDADHIDNAELKAFYSFCLAGGN